MLFDGFLSYEVHLFLQINSHDHGKKACLHYSKMFTTLCYLHRRQKLNFILICLKAGIFSSLLISQLAEHLVHGACTINDDGWIQKTMLYKEK